MSAEPARLPDRTEVLVIGGGIAGCAAACHLARDGREVTLLERHDVGNGASGANAGSLHLQIELEAFLHGGEAWARAYAPTLALLRRSVELWKGLGDDLGADVEAATTGGILLAETDVQRRDIERKARIERAAGLTIELLDRADIVRLAPYASERVTGGALCPDEGKANPLLATRAYARAASLAGARLLRHTEVLGLEQEAGGYRVRTSRGRIAARQVVLAAGPQTAGLAAMLGLRLSIDDVPIQVTVTEPAAPLVPHLVYSAAARLTLKQMGNGTFLIGGGWRAQRSRYADRLTVDLASLRDNMRSALRMVPAIERVGIVRTWPAYVTGTADWRPIIGEAPGLPGFLLAMFPWMGFTAGPVVGRLVADLVAGRDPGLDIAGFRPGLSLAA